MKRMFALIAAVGLMAAMAMAQPAQQPQGAAKQPQAAPQQPAQQQQGQPAPGAKKQPQAKTQEELGEFQKLQDPNITPDQRISAVEEFLKKYPDSELKGYALRFQFMAYQQKNDFVKMREVGERVLETDPEDALTLVLLANAIPERTRETDFDRDQKLKTAEEYAERALKAIDKLEKPNPQMTDAEWEAVRNDARGQSYSAMALVAMNRKQYDKAEENFKKAASMQMQKDPVLYWRMGMAYYSNKKLEQARDAFKQSVALGGVKVPAGDGKTRDVAQEALNSVEQQLRKQSGGGDATAPAPSTSAPATTAPATPAPSTPPAKKP